MKGLFFLLIEVNYYYYYYYRPALQTILNVYAMVMVVAMDTLGLLWQGAVYPVW